MSNKLASSGKVVAMVRGNLWRVGVMVTRQFPVELASPAEESGFESRACRLVISIEHLSCSRWRKSCQVREVNLTMISATLPPARKSESRSAHKAMAYKSWHPNRPIAQSSTTSPNYCCGSYYRPFTLVSLSRASLCTVITREVSIWHLATLLDCAAF
ncbi:hypothetical protein E4T56_gene10593 [Termitomyces sp. T112]|nr:hypothetical protein E4T56_gene10593 [Termitomyces sp. T112]